MNWIDYASLAFGALCVVWICREMWCAGLLTRGVGQSEQKGPADDKRVAEVVDSMRAELDYMRKDGLL